MDSSHLNTRVTLLEKIKNRHNDQAWEEFVYYYQGYISIILKSMAVPLDDCDELCQTIMIKLWEKLPDFEFSSKKARFRTWLCHVVQNEVRSYFRKKNAIKRQHLSTDAEEYFEIPCDSELDTLAEREWNIYVTDLAWNNIVDKLPDHYRNVFLLYLKGKSTQEIMAETDMPSNTVTVYLKRTRDKLKAEIKHLTNELL